MSKKLDYVSPTDPGDFAEAVCALYKHSTERQSEPFRGNVSIEVRRAAFGPALIRNLLDACARSISLSVDIPASGTREAYAILDHLITGRKHPISRHIDGIHSGNRLSVCTAGRSKAVSPAPHTGFLTVPPYSTLGYQPNGKNGLATMTAFECIADEICSN